MDGGVEHAVDTPKSTRQFGGKKSAMRQIFVAGETMRQKCGGATATPYILVRTKIQLLLLLLSITITTLPDKQ